MAARYDPVSILGIKKRRIASCSGGLAAEFIEVGTLEMAIEYLGSMS